MNGVPPRRMWPCPRPRRRPHRRAAHHRDTAGRRAAAAESVGRAWHLFRRFPRPAGCRGSVQTGMPDLGGTHAMPGRLADALSGLADRPALPEVDTPDELELPGDEPDEPGLDEADEQRRPRRARPTTSRRPRRARRGGDDASPRPHRPEPEVPRRRPGRRPHLCRRNPHRHRCPNRLPSPTRHHRRPPMPRACRARSPRRNAAGGPVSYRVRVSSSSTKPTDSRSSVPRGCTSTVVTPASA